MPADDDRPAQQELERFVAAPDAEQAEAFLDALPDGEAALAVSRLSEDEQELLLTTLEPEDAADLLEQVPEVQAVELLERLEPEAAAAILDELPSDEQADLLGELDEADAAAILAKMDPEEARDARELVQYPYDVAGGLMIKEFLAYQDDATVADVLADMRSNAEIYQDYDVQYAYITTAQQELVGVLQLRDLLLARPTQTMRSLMLANPLSIPDQTPLDDLRATFDRYQYYGMPVVNEAGALVGIVRRADVEEALADRSDDQYLKAQGIVGGDELRTMPLLLRSRRRLAWLSVNIVLNIIAASVIAVYQDTLAAVIALAVFLPIISDMSGCSGNQAVAVTMRELTMGLVRPTEMLRVWLKELSVGLINGVALGVLIAAAAWFWQGNGYLGLVVGAAMAANTIVAVSIGGVVPLLLRRLNMDPALASGPILTTITDMCGFFLILSLAATMLPLLTT
jgi:magnesium transporter